MDNKNLSSEALLSNNGDMTSFRYGNSNIRFRTPMWMLRNGIMDILLLWLIMKVWAKRKSILTFCPY